MPSPFPLFRLPLVVLAVVINTLGLEDLMLLICSSRKSRKIAKILYKQKEKVKIRATFLDYLDGYVTVQWENEATFCFFIVTIPDDSNYETVRIEEQVVPIIKKPDEESFIFKGWNFHFENPDHGIKMMFEWLTEFFDRSTVPGLGVCDLSYQDKVRNTIDWMLSKIPKIESCIIRLIEISDDEYAKVLDVCGSINDFIFDVKPSRRFPGRQFSLEGCNYVIYGAFWFSLDNVMNINAEYCYICETKLTSAEMNQFLKFWMLGGCSKIVNLIVEMEVIDLDVLLADLNAVKFPVATRRSYFNYYMRETTVIYGFDIERNDGTLTTIVHDWFQPENCFEMIVWSGL